MELSLDSSFVFVPKTISAFLGQLSAIKDSSQRTSELDAYVKRLEEEQRKIEVFKRELPLCVLLLKNAIERLKEEGGGVQSEEMVGEFLSLKGNCDEDGGIVSGMENSDNKKNWMSSTQLGLNIFDYNKQGNEVDVAENPIEMSNNRGRGGAVLSLKEHDKELSEVPSLSLMTPLMAEVLGAINNNTDSTSKSNNNNSCRAMKLQNKPQQQSQQQNQQQQPFRKQRRCWSPELHRRFVEALQQLGGTQATPKQIRDLMQVEGLTNDEVKSHLQKYRLHIRKLPASAAAQGNNGLWMPLDHSGDHSKANNLLSGSPQGPLLAGGFAKCRSTTGGESGDSREAEEDEKSDGHSWKCGLQNNQEGNV